MAALRAMEWIIPDAVPADTQVQVYDTRLEPAWLRRMVKDICPTAPARVEYIGGDFLTEPRPLREDKVALDVQQLRRWGPDGTEAYHLVVHPRPHQAAWLERSRQQLAMEASGTVITVLCVVARELCPLHWDEATLVRALPGTAVLLGDTTMEVHITAIGERPLLRRVPATCRQLPPTAWEAAHLALNRVMLAVSITKRSGPSSLPLGRWLGEPPPAPKPSAMELLRVEYILPPATRAQQAERSLRAALKETARVVQVTAPALPQLRQLQPEHGGMVALLEVPRGDALAWLRGSGRGGLFLRPFWTKDTAKTLERSNFALWWLRGLASEADTVWHTLQQSAGFFGLLAGGPDIAARVTSDADLATMQEQIRFTLKREQLTFRVANREARWWKFGPFTAKEVTDVHTLIAGLGLTLVRGDVRFSAANYTRTR